MGVYLKLTEDQIASNIKFISIRRRKMKGSLGTVVYGMTQLKVSDDGQEIEMKRIISRREYYSLKGSIPDGTRHIVRQRRTCFLHDDVFFQLDEYQEPISVAGRAILSYQLSESDGVCAQRDIHE